MISTNQILIMLRLQSDMNALVNPNWMLAGYKWARAIMVEAAEACDHHGYKWWRKQETDMPQLRMELIDIVHFGLSKILASYGITNSHMDIALYIQSRISTENVDIPYAGRVFSANQSILEDLDLMAGMAAFDDFSFRLFSNLMNKTGLTWESLAHTYLSKNVLNQFRQKNGYKSGEYCKNWTVAELTYNSVSGRDLEDNDHLHDIMQIIDPNAEKYVEMLLVNLQHRYQIVLDAKQAGHAAED